MLLEKLKNTWHDAGPAYRKSCFIKAAWFEKLQLKPSCLKPFKWFLRIKQSSNEDRTYLFDVKLLSV